MKDTICVDFDGVINLYTNWEGEDVFPPIRPGIKDFLDNLAKRYNIIIYTCRIPDKIRPWLIKEQLPFTEIIKKPYAIAYIDDHAINFSGDLRAIERELNLLEERKKERKTY